MSTLHISGPTQMRYECGAKIVLEGVTGFYIHSGWAFEYLTLAGGQRQITAVHLPGDYVKVARPASLKNEGIEAATRMQIEAFAEDCAAEEGGCQRVLAALQYASETETAKARAWMAVLGRKHALARCAHFFCEIHERISIRQGAVDDPFAMPFTQTQIGDAIGLTGVHTNRVIRSLREGRYAAVSGGHVTIFDLERLRQLAGFDSGYLHPRSAREKDGDGRKAIPAADRPQAMSQAA